MVLQFSLTTQVSASKFLSVHTAGGKHKIAKDWGGHYACLRSQGILHLLWEENSPPFVEGAPQEEQDLHENRVLRFCVRDHLLSQVAGKWSSSFI